MMNCEYAEKTYGVPACIGRIVKVNGRAGIIAEDRGHYLGINFDDSKPGVIINAHPTWKVEYFGIGKIRKMKRSQARYKRFLEYGDGFDSFIEFCRWDADSERSWNNGKIL